MKRFLEENGRFMVWLIFIAFLCFVFHSAEPMWLLILVIFEEF